jgi:hypothetical protein
MDWDMDSKVVADVQGKWCSAVLLQQRNVCLDLSLPKKNSMPDATK